MPPPTSRLVQQLSLLVPQSVRPGPPPTWQLAAAIVEPVHTPPLHMPAAHGQGMLHWPVTSQICTAETAEHCDTPGVQPPASTPPPYPALEPPPLELAVPELLDPELALDPELLPLAAAKHVHEGGGKYGHDGEHGARTWRCSRGGFRRIGAK